MYGLYARPNPGWIVDANLLQSQQSENQGGLHEPVPIKVWGMTAIGSIVIALFATQLDFSTPAHVDSAKVASAAAAAPGAPPAAPGVDNLAAIDDALSKNREFLNTLGSSLASVDGSIRLTGFHGEITVDNKIHIKGEGTCADIAVATAFRDRIAKAVPTISANLTSVERTEQDGKVAIKMQFELLEKSDAKPEAKP